MPDTRPLRELLAWQARGACNDIDVDPELWFSLDHGETLDAIKICRIDCPVMNQCRIYALTEGITAGVYGGLTDVERRREWKRGQPRRSDRTRTCEDCQRDMHIRRRPEHHLPYRGTWCLDKDDIICARCRTVREDARKKQEAA